VYEGPSDTPGIGRFALIADPGGAKLGLIKPAQP
jgi:predicted enzyme related to lactoylglutathione lyase